MMATLLLGGSLRDAHSAPKYFMKIRDTELAAGVDAQAAKNLSEAATPASDPSNPDGVPAVAAPQASPSSKPVAVGEMVRTVLIDTLRKQPDVTLELESPIANTEAVKAECKRKGLRAFELAVRVLRFDRGVKPPAAGKRFRILEQNVKLSVVGTTYPEGLLAVGGDGGVDDPDRDRRAGHPGSRARSSRRGGQRRRRASREARHAEAVSATGKAHR